MTPTRPEKPAATAKKVSRKTSVKKTAPVAKTVSAAKSTPVKKAATTRNATDTASSVSPKPAVAAVRPTPTKTEASPTGTVSSMDALRKQNKELPPRTEAAPGSPVQKPIFDKTEDKDNVATPVTPAQRPATAKASPAPTEAVAMTTPAKAVSKPAASVESGPATGDSLEPIQQLSEIALENTGRLLEMQMDVVRRHSQAMLREYQGMMASGDADAFQAFLSSQPATLLTLSTAAARDIQALTLMSMNYMKSAGEAFIMPWKRA